ncbi:hypothetical protein ACFZDI_25960 [Streptomyces sp. NPDC007907]|uniref:hypothetical protein n=1 Tax=Streptomyces sp. NPDC007907 TaxID=3364789 RepID=UPI0036F17199
MNPEDTDTEPAEHARFAGYLDQLRQVSEKDETGLVIRVLTDPDHTMARSAVLRHLDRRAAELCRGSGWEAWARGMSRAVVLPGGSHAAGHRLRGGGFRPPS